MDFEACFQLGYVSKVHGIKGEVQCYLDVDIPENYKKLESVFVDINNKLIPFFIEKISIVGQRAVVQFEDVETVEQAEELKGKSLYLPLEKLPPLSGNQFYFHDIIGYEVHDSELGVLGTIKDVFALPHQDLIAMDFKNREVLIPVSDDIIKGVDHKGRALRVQLPPGLLQVYLED